MKNKSMVEYEKLKVDLVNYCRKYQEKNEKAGNGTKYRTFKMACKRFNMSCDEIEDLIQDCQNDRHGLDIITGFRVGGLGGATGRIDNHDDYQIEWYDNK